LPKVSEIVSYLYTLAPDYMQEDWDNTGLVVGHGEREVRKLLVALDATLPVLQEAAETGCQLVVTHHPVIFSPLRKINDGLVTGSRVLFAAENHLACVNMHTNLDCAAGGVGELLAQKLGIQSPSVIAPRGSRKTGAPYGYVLAGAVPQMTLQDFVRTVSERLGCAGVRFAAGGKPVRSVAVAGGACGDELYAAAAAGCDTFVTADVKYHQFSEARELGINLIDAGHFETEVAVCAMLAKRLREKFPEISVTIAQSMENPVDFLC